MALKSRSLRNDLLFDLSLLTLCALLLSEAIFIVILRQDLPEQMAHFAPSYLPGVHRRLMDEFKKGSSEDDLQALLARISPSTDLKLSLSETPTSEEFVTQTSKILGLIPYTQGIQWTQPLGDGRFVQYKWSLDSIQSLLTQFKYRVFFLTLLIEVFLVFLAYFLLFRRNVLLPIGELSRVSRDFLEGRWSSRFDTNRKDELGHIGEALNEMAQKIQEKEKKLFLTIESLRAANEELEMRQNEQLQIEKLASIGRLAAGVAHEVGNPLGAVSGYVDILRRSLKKMSNASPEDIELCDRIEAETNRISKIIRALLQQAKPTRERLKSVQLKGLLVRCVNLAQIPTHIDVSYEFEDESAEAWAEEDQLVQIFLNLIMNARHAIEAKKDRREPGTLKVKCALRKLPLYRSGTESSDYDTSVVRALKPEVYWVVTIEDNGIGISEEDQKKLFEPFFSTKAPGKGTGLGLYVTKSIVESFRGAIVVRSAAGFGAAFSIFLPRSRPNDGISY